MDVNVKVAIKGLQAFVDEGSFHGKRAVENAALLCHEANRYYCMSVGDKTQKPWDETADDMKASTIQGVRYVLDAYPDCKPSDTHESWLRERTAAGWKKGPIKNVAAKEHPCLVPFDKLTPFDQGKDHVFMHTAIAALYAYGRRYVVTKPAVTSTVTSQWSVHAKNFELGMLVAHGRATRVVGAALVGLAHSLGMPARVSYDDYPTDDLVSDGVFKLVPYGFAHGFAELAYANYRANQLPQYVPDWPELPPSECTYTKRMWFLLVGITQAVATIEGVMYGHGPEAAMWRRVDYASAVEG